MVDDLYNMVLGLLINKSEWVCFVINCLGMKWLCLSCGGMKLDERFFVRVFI